MSTHLFTKSILIWKSSLISNFNITTKKWNLTNLNEILIDSIMYKIKTIPTPINDTEDKLT